jgi:hypothetical protein
MITTTRNANLTDLVTILRDQHARKIDVVAPTANFGFRDARLVVAGVDPILEADGVTNPNGTYQPTLPFDGDVAAKMGIPVAYLRRLREDRPDLYDANANGLLRGKSRVGADGQRHEVYPGDARSFLLRLFRGDDGEHGVARAMLSDRYAAADNLDVLMSALEGVRAAGVEVDVARADLTDRRMIVKMHAPSIATEARDLLAGYRSPFTGQTGDDCPVVFAGLRITNSETGDGRFTITPEVTVQVCSNGMVISRDVVAQTHIGGRLDAGVVRWSADTERKNLEVVKAKTRDAVATFLSPGYLRSAWPRSPSAPARRSAPPARRSWRSPSRWATPRPSRTSSSTTSCAAASSPAAAWSTRSPRPARPWRTATPPTTWTWPPPGSCWPDRPAGPHLGGGAQHRRYAGPVGGRRTAARPGARILAGPRPGLAPPTDPP